MSIWFYPSYYSRMFIKCDLQSKREILWWWIYCTSISFTIWIENMSWNVCYKEVFLLCFFVFIQTKTRKKEVPTQFYSIVSLCVLFSSVKNHVIVVFVVLKKNKGLYFYPTHLKYRQSQVNVQFIKNQLKASLSTLDMFRR